MLSPRGGSGLFRLLLAVLACSLSLNMLSLYRAAAERKLADRRPPGDDPPRMLQTDTTLELKDMNTRGEPLVDLDPSSVMQAGMFADLFTPAADASEETMWKCLAYGAWSDICVYRRVCFRTPTELVFIANKFPAVRGNRISRPLRGSGMRMATKLPVDNLVHPPQDRYTPFYYRGSEVTFLTPEMMDLNPHVWIRNRTTFIPALQESLTNIWYYSSRIAPLYTIKKRGSEWGLPSLEDSDVLLLGNVRKMSSNWQQAFTNISTTPSTRVIFSNESEYEWLSRPNKLTCLDRAVLMGAQPFVFSDWILAHQFREEAYAFTNTEAPRKAPYTVTLLDRKFVKPRHFANLREISEVISEFGVKMTRVELSERDSFATQVQLMARTGVLVTMHGAGLTNQIFLPPGAAVIEIFPPHAKHVLYERMSHASGVYYFKVYAKEFPDDFHRRHPTYNDVKCEDLDALDVPSHPQCWPLTKNANIIVPIPEFREALLHALDFIERTRDPAVIVDENGVVQSRSPTRSPTHTATRSRTRPIPKSLKYKTVGALKKKLKMGE